MTTRGGVPPNKSGSSAINYNTSADKQDTQQKKSSTAGQKQSALKPASNIFLRTCAFLSLSLSLLSLCLSTRVPAHKSNQTTHTNLTQF